MPESNEISVSFQMGPEVCTAANLVDDFIAHELERQLLMWGSPLDRPDNASGELLQGGIAQLDAVFDRRNGELGAFDEAPQIYPENWDHTAFRDYGSDVANIVVSICLLYQEALRLTASGADTTRLPRDPFHQAYVTAKPNPIPEELSHEFV
jgi:hypothetical protein